MCSLKSLLFFFFFFSSRRRHTRSLRDWSSDVCSSDLFFIIKVRLDHEKPEVDSVVSVWPTANWLERETYDLFGIRFTGHPDRSEERRVGKECRSRWSRY